MWSMIKEAATSKKFLALAATVLSLAAAGLGGAMPWAGVAEKAFLAVCVYMGAQGLADIGKSKAKIESTASKG